MLALLYAALVSGLVGITPSLADDAATDAQQLRGTWAAVGSFDAEGRFAKLPEDDPRHVTFEFGADKLSTRFKTRTIEGTYKVDPAKSPKEIDIKRQRKGEEVTFKGIYAIEGDRLRICLAGAGNERPTQFKSGEGIEFAVEFNRVK